MIPFGKLLPDYGPEVDGLLICNNLLPTNGKLMPLRGLSEQAGSVSGTPLYAFLAQDNDGITKLFIATSTGVYRNDAGTPINISKVGGYSSPIEAWDHTVYGNTLIMTNGLDSIQAALDFNTALNLTDLGGTPPIAKQVCLYHDHLFLGYTIESGTEYPRRIFRSAKGNLEDWVVDPDTGCGYRDIPSWGEQIVAIDTIGDYLIVYMTGSIWIIDEVGAPIWFSYSKIFEGQGPLSPGSIAKIDQNRHIWFSKDDIYVTDVSGINPVGSGIRSILQSINPDYLNRINNIVNFQAKVVIWSYPSLESSGTPDKLLIYNWEEDRFTTADLSVGCLCVLQGEGEESSTLTIDGLDTIANTIDELLDSIDSYGAGSGSSFRYDYSFGGISPSGNLATLTGDVLDAVVRTGQLYSESVIWVTTVRPAISRCTGTITCTIYWTLDEMDEFQVTSAVMDSKGYCNLRVTAKFFEFEFLITGSHNGIRGFTPKPFPREM